MNWPLLGRIASAPIRPLIAVKLLVLVETCTIGFWPSPLPDLSHVTPPRARGGCGVLQRGGAGGASAHEFEIALKELLVLRLLRRERRCADAESRCVATTAPDCANSESGACRDGEQNANKRAGA